MDSLPYFPGDNPRGIPLLERYLPLVHEGVASAFLSQHNITSSWILDPFGIAPSLAVEMARAGKQVLVAVNNPILRFLLELSANPPSRADLQAALSELASIRKGEERLENHLRSLYLTECLKCKRQISAEAFIWEKEGTAPISRIYRCPCGEKGEFPVTSQDVERVARIANTDHLHRSRALEYVASPEDPDRFFVERALEFYLPRAVYVLITIVNKLSGITLPVSRHRALLALLLTAFDEGNTLWPFPTERPRPRQLTVPPRFLEKNIWLSMEQAIEKWEPAPSIPTITWKGIERQEGSSGRTGEIYVFEGPLRDLAPGLSAIQPGAVVTVLPRPNQAFWILSALWTGWLWGQEVAARFKPVLRRRRFDWNWHTEALCAALKHLSSQLPLNAPLFSLIPEPEPAFLSAAMLAAAGAGFDLEGLALRTRHDPVQVLWRRRAFLREDKDVPEIDPKNIMEAIDTLLRTRGEPAQYLHLHAAGLAALAEEHSLKWQEGAHPALLNSFQGAISSPGFSHISDSTNPESGLWSLSSWDEIEPLPDLVEIALVNFLQRNPGVTFRDIETHLNSKFQGLNTPSHALVRAILSSYGIETDKGWSLRSEDSPPVRLADLNTASHSLEILASRLGYSVIVERNPWRIIRWLEKGERAFVFHVIASAVAGKILRKTKDPPNQCILVLPGGRAGLFSYKMDRIPDLKFQVEQWRVVKFRHLRKLAEMHNLSRDNWERELDADPLERPEQMKLF